jgi:hypothetical protein
VSSEEPVAEPEPREEPVPAPAAPAEPARREHLRPVPDLAPVPDLPREPVREEPLEPVAVERRKRHEMVRFDRRVKLTRDRHGAVERTTSSPVRELRSGRRKNHVVVRFDAPDRRQPGEHPEQEHAWQVFDQAEA